MGSEGSRIHRESPKFWGSMPPDPPNLRGFTARIVICPGKLIALKPPMVTRLCFIFFFRE